MNTLIPGAPLRSLSPTSIEYQRAQGASRAAKPARAARFTLDAPEHSGTIPGAIGDILPPGVALTSNLAVIFTLNQYTQSLFEGFSATMGLSDFPHPFVAVVLLADSQRGPRRYGSVLIQMKSLKSPRGTEH